MNHGNWKRGRGVFGVMVLGALGFGASQAFATTPPEWIPPGQTCYEYCIAKFGEGTQPVYIRYVGGQWQCSCIP